MKNWIVRSLTGIIYIAVIVGALLGNGMWIYLLTLLLGLPALYEFKRLCMKGLSDNRSILILDMLGLGFILLIPTSYALWGIIGLPCYFIARLIFQVYEREHKPLTSFAGSLAAMVYIALPLAAMLAIAYMWNGGNYLLLAMFILIWINDTGAFVVGCTLGKHRLFERVSPKKSWEGFFGGLFFALAASIAIFYFTGWYEGIISSPWLAALAGVIVTVAATYGDLLESSIKRASGVKDSGHLLPGHGGMLDRIDSLLLVVPSTLLLLMLIKFL